MRALAGGPADLGLREILPWMEWSVCMRTARGNRKKFMLQQACESGDLELPEAVRRPASGSPFPWQPNLDAVEAVVTRMQGYHRYQEGLCIRGRLHGDG